LSNRSSSPDTSSLHSADQIGEDVLMGCSVQLHDKLDITSLHPHLSAHYLLTRDDTDILTNVTTTNSSKITHLLKVLPRKDKGWFDKFLICLHNSSEGNGHAGLVKDLKSKFKELSGSEHSLDKQNMTEVVPKENSEVHTHRNMNEIGISVVLFSHIQSIWKYQMSHLRTHLL